MVAWDSILAGIGLLAYALLPEPTDTIPALGWIDEAGAVVAGLALIVNGLNGVHLKDAVSSFLMLKKK